MPSTQPPQPLPSFNLVALRSDHYTTVLPNLSYPYRPNVWSGSSAPLLFVKTTRPELTTPTTNPNIQVPTTLSICFYTCSVPDTFHRVSALVWHNLSMLVRKLKLIKQKLFGVTAMGSSVTASVWILFSSSLTHDFVVEADFDFPFDIIIFEGYH